MAAHEESLKQVVTSQQSYASMHDLAGIFEALTLLIIFKKPSNIVEYIGEEAAKLKGTKHFEPPLVNSITLLSPILCFCSLRRASVL